MIYHKQKKGFTMLEMIAALGVFATVAVLSVSSLLSLTGAQKKALALQSVQDNLRFTLESIARDLRQGDFFYCGNDLADIPPAPDAGKLPATRDCPIGNKAGNIITFRDRQLRVTTYKWGNISCDLDGAGHLCIEKMTRTHYSDPIQPELFSPLTSRDIQITRLDFYVTGSEVDTDQTDPRITIVVEGTSGSGRNISDFHLQTTVSRLQPYRN